MKSNIVFRKLEDNDYLKLQEFCDTCKELGYYNNQSFDEIKLDKMKMPYGQFFIGYDLDKNIIFNLCGVHHMPELSENAWRVFFRGATLPSYTTGGLGIRSGFQLMEILNMQIDFIVDIDPNAEFYITTNVEKSLTNAKSQKMGSIMAPRLVKQGFLKKIKDNFYYMNTYQSLWKIDVSKYKEWRII